MAYYFYNQSTGSYYIVYINNGNIIRIESSVPHRSIQITYMKENSYLRIENYLKDCIRRDSRNFYKMCKELDKTSKSYEIAKPILLKKLTELKEDIDTVNKLIN